MVAKTLNADRTNGILKQKFINRKDFIDLLGLEGRKGNEFYSTIKQEIKKELEIKGLRLPDKYHVPLDLVLKHLKQYGIVYKQTQL